jgi:ATP-dependent Clp protease ATP-binding subunit ClpA
VRHCIILCTSNAVTARDLVNPGIGFSNAMVPVPSRQALTVKLSLFRSELLNRFDDLLAAAPLSPSSQISILRRHLAAACDRACAAGVSLPGEEELAALLHAHAAAIDAEGGRAIERLAADTVLRSLGHALQQRRVAASLAAVAPVETEPDSKPEETALI